MNQNIKNLTAVLTICAVTVLSGCSKVTKDLSEVKEARGKFVNQCATGNHAEAQHDQGPDAPSLEKFQQACGCYYDKGIEAYPDKKKLPRAVLSFSTGEDEHELGKYMDRAMNECNKTFLKK